MDSLESITLIKQHVKVVERLHNEFSGFFYADPSITSLNLKNTKISTLALNTNFLATTLRYRDRLSDWVKFETDLVPLIDQDWHVCKFNYRTKLEDSFFKKMHWYLNKSQPYYVLKTFNDLFGARLIIPNFRSFENSLLDYYGSKSDNMVRRAYIRDDTPSYHGLHLYISPSNTQFPWELQIWDTADEKANLFSHDMHEKRKEDKD